MPEWNWTTGLTVFERAVAGVGLFGIASIITGGRRWLKRVRIERLASAYPRCTKFKRKCAMTAALLEVSVVRGNSVHRTSEIGYSVLSRLEFIRYSWWQRLRH